MSAVSAYLRQLDDAWGHAWESMTAVLTGMSEAEAEWQAPCYAKEPREEGEPPAGSVRWQVAHVAQCKRYYAECIRRRGTAAPPHPPPVVTLDFAGNRRELEAAHDAERTAIAECTDADLATSVGGSMPLGEFLSMVIRHDTWHAGQIAVARRLWRTRG